MTIISLAMQPAWGHVRLTSSEKRQSPSSVFLRNKAYGLEPAVARGQDSGVDAVPCTELLQQVLDVTFDSELTELDLLCDLAVGEAVCHKAQDGALSVTQRLTRVIGLGGLA